MPQNYFKKWFFWRDHWQKWPLHFVDTETTSLDPASGEVIEVAIITDHLDGHTTQWQVKIRPVRMATADPKSLEINGYTEESWSSSSAMAEVAGEIAKRLKYGTIIGHNVAFDMAFLRAELARYGINRLNYRKICTQSLALSQLPMPYVSLKNIREFFGWSSDLAHTAHQDALDCRKLFYLLHRAPFWRRLWWSWRYWRQKKKEHKV